MITNKFIDIYPFYSVPLAPDSEVEDLVLFCSAAI